MKKYKQTVIPEASTNEWKHLSVKDMRKRMLDEYQKRHKGKNVVNQHLGITINFQTFGAKKTSRGAAAYSKKACLISVLDKLVRYAEYSNWGERKSTGPSSVVGFLNFKAKVKIDGKLEHIHLAVCLRNDGKFHYSMEVNKKSR